MTGPVQTLPGMRALLVLASILVLIIGLSLFLLSSQTEWSFAWTVNPPLTAAFLGASYLSAFVLELRSAREKDWARARLAVPAVLAFTTLTLIATLLHLERFHFQAAFWLTLVVTWVWLVVYATVPVLMAVLLFLQLRVRGAALPRQAPLPPTFRGLIFLQGAMMFGLGAALFLNPLDTAVVWPWVLTPLTGRAVGAWLLGLGISLLHSAWENDWSRMRATALSMVVFGVLQVIVLARYLAVFQWSGMSAWVYVVFLLSLLSAGAAAAARTRPSSSLPNPAAAGIGSAR
jgi:hypothetical protein